MKKSNLLFLETLAVSPAEKVEIKKALDRRYSLEWVNARNELKGMCEIRTEEKKKR